MKATPVDGIQTDSFEVSTRLNFAHIFQSAPYWHGVGYGFMPQLVRELRSTQHKKSYLLSFGQRLLVLTVEVSHGSFIDEPLQQQSPIIELAYKAGIGPRLVYSSPEKGFVVSEYIEGDCFRPDDFQRTGNIERVAQTLKQLHALPAEGPSFSAGQLEQRYWSDIATKQAIVCDSLHALQLKMKRVAAYAQKHYPERAVCHNNLHVSNVLETEQTLRFVGWEQASVNDPYYDLAVIAYQHEFDDVQIDQLLFHYAGRVGEEQRTHFYYCYAIHIYLHVLRCVVEQGEPRSADQARRLAMQIDALHAVVKRLAI